MNLSKIAEPLRENPFSAAAAALGGAAVGFAWTASAASTSLPPPWKLTVFAEIGALAALASWLVSSSVFARRSGASVSTVRRIDALTHVVLFPYLLAVFAGILQLSHMRADLLVYALVFFIITKLAETAGFLLPGKTGMISGPILFVVGVAIAFNSLKHRVLGELNFWKDREEIPFAEESSPFYGRKVERVYVNADGEWRPATKVLSGGVYTFGAHFDAPSRVGMGFLYERGDDEGEVRIKSEAGNTKERESTTNWEEPGWEDVNLPETFATGEARIRVSSRLGSVWVSDPAVTSHADRPNIIVIFIDALRADHLGCYDYERPTSPFIDSLAQKGTLFEKHYAPSSWTTSSMASFFTGRYSRQHGCVDFGSLFLPLEFDTLVELLRKSGYYTYGISGNPLLSVKTGFAQGFQRFDESCFSENLYRSGECLTEVAKRNLPKNRPLFLFMHYFDPHLPYLAPPPDLFSFRGETVNGRIGDMVGFSVNRYDEAIRYNDRQIEKLFDALEKGGILDNAVVIITADHGEEMADHGRFNHGNTVYEEVIHIPLIIIGHGFPAGKRFTGLTSAIDLYATILGVAGLTPDPRLPTRAMPPLGSAGRGWVISDMHAQTAYRTERYKFIVDTSLGKKYLFDLDADPDEHYNLADREPSLANRAYTELRGIVGELDKLKPPSARTRRLIGETEQRLKALGYVQ